MGDRTKIEWTRGDDGTPGATWNPVVGCSHVSPGCDNCYAASLVSGRLRNVPVYAGLAEGGKFTGEVRVVRERLDQPLRWRRPRRIFVNSMSDLFHPGISDDAIYDVFSVMLRARHHTFQVLTKRPQRMREWLGVWGPFSEGAFGDPDLRHIWLGTSIESNRYAFRADHLRDAPGAVVRFVSAEPLLGPLDELDLTGIDWLIVGGESGRNARPYHRAWARDLRDRCAEAGVAFHFKQHGEWASYTDSELHSDRLSDGLPRLTLTRDGELLDDDALCDPEREPSLMLRVGKKAAGRRLDYVTHDGYPA